MKKSHLTVIFFALTLIFCGTTPVGAFEIGARGLYWFPAITADMRSDALGLPGTLLNLKDNLGVGNESFPVVEAFVGSENHRLSLAYTPIDYSGSARLTSTVTFNGKTFSTGTNVNTDLTLRMLDLEYQYKFLNLENILAGFSLGLIGQIKYIDGEAKMNAPATNTQADFSARLPIPMVGLGTHIGILAGIFEARAKVTGIAYSSNYLYDALADLSLTPFPFLDIHGGYKIIRLKIDHSSDFLDAQFAGPFVGLTVSF